MFKRLSIYLREMYPLPSRLMASMVIFASVYIGAVYASNLKLVHFGYQELIGMLTVFLILLGLRIIDEFKDAKTDMVNFPNRPLPSGRVNRNDLIKLEAVVVAIILILNLGFMPNKISFIVMFFYACLMSVWFFAKKYIQPNLLLALITHNPIQLLIVFYIMSIAGSIYSFSIFNPNLLLLALVFYFPGLTWEISRKIRAPKEENQYVTYSQIFGRSRAIQIIVAILLVQLVAAMFVYGQRNLILMAVGALIFCVYFVISLYNIKHPESQNYGKIARVYLCVFQALLMVVGLIGSL